VRYAAKLGVPIEDSSKFGLFQPETLEQGVAMVCISANEGVDLIVLDSVGAALPKAAFEISMEEILKAETKAIGLQARVWSTALPMILGHLKVGNTALLAIAQQRDSISTGPGGAKGSSVQGGNAWKYYSAVRMEMRAIGQIVGRRFDPLTHSVDDKASLGTNVSVRMKKSKVSGTTNYETTVECFPNVGFDPLYTSASVAVDQGVIKKGGAWYTWDTCSKGEVRGQGFKALLANLRNIPGVQEELDTLLRPRMCDPSSEGGEAEVEEVDYSDPDMVDTNGKLSTKQIVAAANGMVDGKFTSGDDD
jgi:recombination protein RecA